MVNKDNKDDDNEDPRYGNGVSLQPHELFADVAVLLIAYFLAPAFLPLLVVSSFLAAYCSDRNSYAEVIPWGSNKMQAEVLLTLQSSLTIVYLVSFGKRSNTSESRR